MGSPSSRRLCASALPSLSISVSAAFRPARIPGISAIGEMTKFIRFTNISTTPAVICSPRSASHAPARNTPNCATNPASEPRPETAV